MGHLELTTMYAIWCFTAIQSNREHERVIFSASVLFLEVKVSILSYAETVPSYTGSIGITLVILLRSIILMIILVQEGKAEVVLSTMMICIICFYTGVTGTSL